MNREAVEKTMEALAKEKPWDTEPVFVFSCDIDWASETVLHSFFEAVPLDSVNMTVFVTHHSGTIDKYAGKEMITLAPHPNFLSGSSHGSSFDEVIESVERFAPEGKCFRAHRFFEVSDVTHRYYQKGMKFFSNTCTVLQTRQRPFLHESGLVAIPIFFQDGTHLLHRLELSLRKYQHYFESSGLKVISMHPMNFVINPPEIEYMRSIKRRLSRDEYNNIDEQQIVELRYDGVGIKNVIEEIFEFARGKKILSLQEVYDTAVSL